MKVLFLQGRNPEAARAQTALLSRNGHEVIAPHLTYQGFDRDLKIAQAEFDRIRPDLIVGSARGGALAMNLSSGETRLVLVCPKWRKWGTSTTVKQGTTILHSDRDYEVRIKESEELVQRSGLNPAALIKVGDGHDMDDPKALSWLLEACWDDRYHAIHEASHAVTALKFGLVPLHVRIGGTAMGTSGRTDFHSWVTLHRDPKRYLTIAVAGCVGTRLVGYGNQLVSEGLWESCGIEPGWMSDAMRPREYSLSEIRGAESWVRKILERKRRAVEALADGLVEKRELGKDEIRALVAQTPKKLCVTGFPDEALSSKDRRSGERAQDQEKQDEVLSASAS